LNISSLTVEQLKKKLSKGLSFQIGNFNICLTSSIPNVCIHIKHLYSEYEVLSDDVYIDFYIELCSPTLIRCYIRPQVVFSFDGYIAFKPLPLAQAGAMFEWGLNWCIANHSNQYLIIHAAVVELNGCAFVFPGAPGNGKSTLCAALVCNGWRLLSDEMTLVSIEDGLIYPVPRPTSLKNQSINIIKNYSKNAVFGEVVKDTAKGTIGHMRAPDNSVRCAHKPAQATKLIFPKYTQGAATELTALSKGKTVLRAAEQCFNYSALGSQGFETLCSLVGDVGCFEFSYSSLDEAVALFSGIAH